MDLSGHKKKKSVKIPKGYGTTISYMGHHLIVVTKEAIDVVSAKRHKTKEYNPDPYGRNNQKKQGRENKNKNRTKENYKPKNNKRNNMPAKPKKHTPGRGHNKYKGRK